ncbi:MAG: TaqI-like C-terminal specificity domain-containing protein, partial [Promethearchaeota archaeon]
ITHKKLRKFILNHCIINEILLAPKNLFSSQKVSTSPVIIILTKCSGSKNRRIRESNIMRIIPRVSSEEEYNTPLSITKVVQKKYNSLPFNLFFSEVEDEIIELFEKAPKLEEYLRGYIGMHTHNNRKYIAAVEDTELELVFRKRNEKITDLNRKYHIISKKDFDFSQWKPYLKRGGDDQYYRMIIEALDWRKESMKNYDIPINVPFEKEGIVISGVSSRLAARYMPENCYWDSNKAIGFIRRDNRLSISYMLGLLNSSLYNYLAKGIINNTNSIQITGIHALPFIEPDTETQYKIESLSNEIINSKKYNKDFNYIEVQKKIDSLIYDMYSKRFNFPSELKKKIDKKYSIYKNELINAIN